VAFRGYAGSAAAAAEVQVAFLEKLGRSLRITVGYPVTWREVALKRAKAVVEGLRFLAKDTKLALASELATYRDSQTTVGKTDSVRNGTYRNFGLDVAWTRPDPSWTFLSAELVRSQSPNALFRARSVELGLDIIAFTLPVEASTTEAVFAQRFAEMAAARGATSTALKLSFGEVAVSGLDELPTRDPSKLGAGSATGLERHLTGLAVKAGSGFALSVFGSNEVLQAQRAKAIAAIRAFRLSGIGPERGDREGTYYDHRWGYAFTAPPGWTRIFHAASAVNESTERVRWAGPGGAIELMLLDIPALIRGEELLEMLLNRFIQDSIKSPAQRVNKQRATLGDLMTYEATLDGVPVLVGARGRVTFTWFSEPNDTELFTRVRAGFRILD